MPKCLFTISRVLVSLGLEFNWYCRYQPRFDVWFYCVVLESASKYCWIRWSASQINYLFVFLVASWNSFRWFVIHTSLFIITVAFCIYYLPLNLLHQKLCNLKCFLFPGSLEIYWLTRDPFSNSNLLKFNSIHFIYIFPKLC